MKTRITIILVALSALIILDTLNAGQAITAFVLTGAIPGTSVSISASAMLIFYALIGGFIFARLMKSSRRHGLTNAS